MILGLGVTASHKRVIKPGTAYNKYFPATVGTNPLLSNGADVFETVDLVEKVVKGSLDQTAKIATVLKGSTLQETCRKIFNFCYQHIQYKLDKPGEEQLRTPARAWKDRKTGIDCDCFTVFVSSILHNLGIKHAYRICEINSKGYYQHIYVVVPSDQSTYKINPGKYFTIDPVLDRFNTEAPGITKVSDKMTIPVRMLNGIDDQFLGEIESQNTLEGVYSAFKGKLKQQVKAARKHAVNAPKCLSGIDDQTAFLGMLDFADQVIDSASDNGLAELTRLGMQLESQEAINGLSGYEGLGKGKFLKKVAASVKAVKTEVKKAGATANKSGALKKVKEVANKAVKAAVKFNPAVATIRAGFLIGMNQNIFGIADRVKWAYATPEQLKNYGISNSDHQASKDLLAKIEKLFISSMQGDKNALRKAILSGKQKLSGLGVVATASTTAAMTFLLKVKEWADKVKKITPKLSKVTEAIKKGKATISSLKKDKPLVESKPEATIENGEIKDDPAPALPPMDNSGSDNSQGTPPPDNTPSTEYTATSEGSNMAAEDNSAPPPPPEKKSNSGLIFGGLTVLALGAVALSGKKKKGLGDTQEESDLAGTSKKKAKRKIQSIIVK